MRSEFSECPVKTTTQLPFTIIHHAGERANTTSRSQSATHPNLSPAPYHHHAGAAECLKPTHPRSLFLPGDDPSTVVPAPSLLSRLWSKSKYAQGYIKIHQGATTYWQKKSRDGLALSEGTTQHEGHRGNILNRGQLKQDLRGPHHPFFFCVNCPEKCYYEVKCLPGCLVLGAKIIKWRLRSHV